MPGDIVQYTHQSKVLYEMEQFVGMMRASGNPHFFIISDLCSQKCLEAKNVSPFAMAAWVHAVFAWIHPFTVSALCLYFMKCTENRLRMVMAVFPACLRHCLSFMLATLTLMFAHLSRRNTYRLYSK
jgi:hypothetical protein